ncbi:Catalase [Salinisphaera dokdonensis CL-ES53]|uniref:Catalase n=1 Tax=Salinisphaera dokdonensis CL-ES53 TaxID=1304272 RepID=A0ABV2B1G5_9GAMM
MRFAGWGGVEAHRSQGGTNRVRCETYRHSADFRARFNAFSYIQPG